MREIADRLAAWNDAGTRYAVATVVAVRGSAPRPPGAAPAVAADGEAAGSVSGGCVETAVYDLCREALATGRVLRETFGYCDDDAFAVDLTCGGTIEVLVRPGPVPEPALAPDGHTAVAWLMDGAIVVVGPGGHTGTTGRADVDRAVAAEARAMLEVGRTGLVAYVGALGSRRTHRDRLARLRDAGLSDRDLARLRAPIGLDLGARTPQETAVAIAAEFTAARHGGTALPLGQINGPIHHDRPAPAGAA